MEDNQHDGRASAPPASGNESAVQWQQQQLQQQSKLSQDAANKRAALAGQWRTPPMPLFAANPAPAKPQEGAPLARLPDFTEDYAKALQEAYRRGAEAAQALAEQRTQQQQAHLMPSASCPDFHQQEKARPQLFHSGSSVAVAASPTANPAPPPQPIVPNPLSMPPPTSSTLNVISSTTTGNTVGGVAPGVVSMPAPFPSSLGPSTVVPQPQQQHIQAHQQHPQLVHPGTVVVNPAAAAPLTQVFPPAQRSMSLPDMSTYAAQQEEEKRQKRLARNRASARLRRLRKKNLVEAYEQEVGILEKTLSQLQAHEWGESDNVAALTEALSMDRGQQVLTFEQRHKAATGLLDQQLQWIEMLEEILMEDYVLQNVCNGEFAELREILGLDEEQLNRIEASKSGWDEEWAALQTLKGSLIAMRENDWLWNENVSAIAEQFMGILHKNQVSKFLLWADHNAEAIDELDGVNAYPGTQNGPVFAFGVESQQGENYGEDDK